MNKTNNSKIENDFRQSSYISENAIMMLFDKVLAASNFVKSQYEDIPTTGMILGTGLKGLVSQMDIYQTIPYASIPHFPNPTVISHGGELIVGRLGERAVIALTGRFHYYEGFEMEEVTFGIRVLAELGISNLMLTNITGSVNPAYNTGDLVVIKDHINLQSANPLRMRNYDDRLGPRFPSMLNAYNQKFIDLAKSVAASHDISLHVGIYTAMDGPSLETPAEYQMIHDLGGDVIGMSTVPEVIVAKQKDLKTLVLSIVSNKCFPLDELKEDSIDTILANVEKGVPQLEKLVLETLKAMA